ncbi:MAG: hypothetical protein QW304_07575 [Thermoproteota archaeon]
MEIQLGFRLATVKELKVLAQALELAESKEFVDLITIKQSLEHLSSQELELRKRVDELVKIHGLYTEIDQLKAKLEELKEQEKKLMAKVEFLKVIEGD